MQDAIAIESTPVPIPLAHQFYGAVMPNPPSRRPRDPLLIAALALFAVGVLAVVAIFLTSILSDGEPGLWLYLVAMTGTPLGLLLAVVFALWSGRRTR